MFDENGRIMHRETVFSTLFFIVSSSWEEEDDSSQQRKKRIRCQNPHHYVRSRFFKDFFVEIVDFPSFDRDQAAAFATESGTTGIFGGFEKTGGTLLIEEGW